jgi:hypothetical protein
VFCSLGSRSNSSDLSSQRVCTLLWSVRLHIVVECASAHCCGCATNFDYLMLMWSMQALIADYCGWKARIDFFAGWREGEESQFSYMCNIEVDILLTAIYLSSD